MKCKLKKQCVTIEPVSDQIIEDNLGGILERKMLRMVNTQL